MDPDATSTTLVPAAVWLPTVTGGLPLVLKHYCQSGCCMSVDGFMVLVQRGLPFSGPFVVELVGTLPGRQSCIPLPPPEMWLIAWGVWCPCTTADIEDRNPLEVSFSETLVEVRVLVSVPRFGPCFPDCSYLYDDFDCNAGVLGQSYQASNQGSVLGLRAVWHACDGP